MVENIPIKRRSPGAMFINPGDGQSLASSSPNLRIKGLSVNPWTNIEGRAYV
jgi:hypothetical protein